MPKEDRYGPSYHGEEQELQPLAGSAWKPDTRLYIKSDQEKAGKELYDILDGRQSTLNPVLDRYPPFNASNQINQPNIEALYHVLHRTENWIHYQLNPSARAKKISQLKEEKTRAENEKNRLNETSLNAWKSAVREAAEKLNVDLATLKDPLPENIHSAAIQNAAFQTAKQQLSDAEKELEKHTAEDSMLNLLTRETDEKAALANEKRMNLYRGLFRYWHEKGYTPEQITAIITEIQKQVDRRSEEADALNIVDAINQNVGARLNTYNKAYQTAQPYTNPLYYQIPGAVLLLLSISLIITAFVAGQYSAYIGVFFALGVGSIGLLVYGSENSAKTEFWAQVNAQAETTAFLAKDKQAVTKEKEKHRGVKDFVWETAPIWICGLAFLILMVIDAVFLGQTLGTVGETLHLSLFSPENQFLKLLDYALLMAIPAVLIGGGIGVSPFKIQVKGVFKYIIEKIHNAHLSRGYKVLEDSLNSVKTAFFMGTTLVFALGSTWVPLLVGSIAFLALGVGLYQKFYNHKDTFTMMSMPTMPGTMPNPAANDAINVNNMIMYSAGILIGCAAIATAAFLLASPPTTLFCVGLIVAAAMYGPLKSLMNAHKLEDTDKLIVKSREKEMQSMQGTASSSKPNGPPTSYHLQYGSSCAEDSATSGGVKNKK